MRLEPRRRRTLPYAERKMLESLINDPRLNPLPADSVEGGWVHAPGFVFSTPVADAKTRQLKAVLEAGSPQDESPQYKRWRDRRIKQLEGRLIRDTIPYDQFHMKRDDTKDYKKVVDGLVKQNADPERKAAEEELKSLLRERDPENPDAGKLTYLRQDRRIQT